MLVRQDENDNKDRFTVLISAKSVPDASVTWWVDGKQIGRHILDKNFKIRGLGPESELFILPVSDRYYGTYECRAENKYGTAVHPIQLAVAHPPGQIRQVVVEKVTASLPLCSSRRHRRYAHRLLHCRVQRSRTAMERCKKKILVPW